ncbi:MAG: T9SS type A sorting domain-containing protein [Chitinophagaceae bacterium]
MNLSTLFRTKFKIGVAIRIGIFLLLPLSSFSQAFFGVARTPADNAGQAGPTVAVAPPGAMLAGDLVVIYGEYRGTGVTVSMSATGGQTWTTETAPAGSSNQTFGIFWCRYNGTWAANPSVTVGAGGNGLSAIMYVYRPSVSTNSWGIHIAAVNTTTASLAPIPITGLTTTVPNTVTMAFWGSPAANTWGTLTGAGWLKTGLGAQYRNTTSGQSHTAAYNIRATAGIVANVSQTQSTAQITKTSIISWYELAPPANNLCAGAITLTSAASCVNTGGTLAGATYTAIPTIGCGVIDRNDVWYSFVAQSTNPTITLSSAPANVRLQLFSGTCAALTSVACGNASIAAAGLTIGNTYYVRVYTDPNAPGLATALTFNICITDPVPANDLCAGAVLLTSSGACVNTRGTLAGSTYTVISPLGCGIASRNDVWYRFVAQTTSPTITLSSTPANPRLQLFSGVCGTLTSVACGTTSIAATGLTIGNTYYIRVYTDPNVYGYFDICVTDPPPVNDLCSNAISLNSGSCVNTAGTMAGATYTNIPTIGCGVASRNDVWYSFVAQTTSPTITLSSTPANPQLQLFSGTCAALTSVACGTTSIVAAGLTIGNTYYIRVYTNPDVNGTFNICITDPAPSNNLCGSAIVLTSSTSCVNTAGNMFGSTLTATTITAPDCATGATYDIWYRFVAQTTNPTISLSSIGASFAGVAGLQLLSNNCGGTFTSYFCGTTSIAANFLTPGNTYFIRVYGTGALPTLSSGNGFNICVVDPISTPPSNDNCSGAINLPVFNSCSNNPGDMSGATISAVPLGGTCTGPNAYDVWYRFVAANATATVTLSGLGANFTNSGIEILSGSCGSLVSVVCANGLTVTAPVLIPGNTYFIRVYSRTAPPPNGNARFNICLTTTGLPVRFGNSYVNISKRTTGGVVEKGDTLEIRMTVNHLSGTMYNLRYVDNVPTKTAMLTGATDRIRVITNEGLAYKQYTLAAGDDGATYKTAPGAGEYNVRMNIAFGATATGTPVNNTGTEFATATGQMVAGSDRPRGGGGLLFATAYRVVVTGNKGDTINLNAGQFLYKTASGVGADVALTATPFKIVISEPLNLCSNSIGVNNASEYAGTFGSGTTLNRSTDLTIPIAGYTFIEDVNAYNGVGDGRYAIVKNISPRSGTVRTARRRNTCSVPAALAFDDLNNCNNRMFDGFWYIDGDHSGTNNSVGNTPPAESTNGSYMLMVNADYVASEVFRQNITNLCPNTYYEFSAWIRNICPVCGIDSTGAQFTGTATAPAGGYPGVYPNLSFALNDVDYYNTGQVDTLGWLKKGFVFRTDTAQTSATFSIRNNAQGGGGNDWVIDDIAVATCLPTMAYSPTINPNVCVGNSITIADTISSYFKNYTTYKWQRSVNSGASWTDVTGVTTLADTNHYITTYAVPSANTNLADSGNLYRVVVATTAANLVNVNCNISDGVTITLSVLDCGPVLAIDLLSFNGKLVNGKANLSWTTAQEDSPVTFIIERSSDGRTFSPAGEVQGYNNGHSTNNYTFIDPVSVTDKIWYRIAMVTPGGKKKYSSVIQLYNSLPDFELTNMVNPFTGNLAFDITISGSSSITAELIDISGKVVLASKQLVYTGTNSISLSGTQSLASGIYTLRVINKDKLITKRVIKN